MGEGEVSPSLQPGSSATFSSGLQTPARNAWLTPTTHPQNLIALDVFAFFVYIAD